MRFKGVLHLHSSKPRGISNAKALLLLLLNHSLFFSSVWKDPCGAQLWFHRGPRTRRQGLRAALWHPRCAYTLLCLQGRHLQPCHSPHCQRHRSVHSLSPLCDHFITIEHPSHIRASGSEDIPRLTWSQESPRPRVKDIDPRLGLLLVQDS